MSLELLKEKFNEKPMTYQVIDQIEEKQRIIENLEAEASEFANEVATLKNEKNILLRELNKARNFEGSVFSLKEKEQEKDYINELQSKENIIKEIKSEFNPLYKKIDEQKDKLHYADDIMKKYTDKNKELNEKINKLNYSLNFEKKNNKEVISEMGLERKRIHQDYINNLDAYEKALISKNEIIKNHRGKLKESLNRLKAADTKISSLKGEIYSLSKEVNSFSSLSQENFTLQKKLQKAENFENSIARVDKYADEIKVKDDIIEDKRQELLEGIKQINDLGAKIDNLQFKNKQDEETIENLKSTAKKNKSSFISQNDDFKNVMEKKDNYIVELKKKSEALSENIGALSDLARENHILQNKLQKAENFENSFTRVDKYKGEIKVKDDIIEDRRQELLESIRQINNLSTKIDNLQSKNEQDEETIESLKFNESSFISEINDFKNIMKKKDNYMVELKKESETLSAKVVALSDLARENHILQNKLQEAESFQKIITNKKDKFEKYIKETSRLNVSNVIDLLTNVSREKQGNQKLTWNKWLDIPENNYLLNLDETMAKKIFNQSNRLIQEKTIREKKIQVSHSTVPYARHGGPKVTKIHYGLEFNGTNQSLNTTFPSDHDTTQTPIDRTYSWWMKSDETRENRGVFGYGNKDREAFNLNYTTGGGNAFKPNLWLGTGAGEHFYRYWDNASEQDDGQWHHWMVTVDVSDIAGCKLYIDGAEASGGTTNHNNADSLYDHLDELTIGACDSSTSATSHFKGSIMNFAVFTGILSSTDAVRYYNNGIPKDLSSELNLEGYWKMVEGEGTTVADSVGGRDGTFDDNQPTWTGPILKETDHVQGGISFMKNVTTGQLEAPRLTQ